MESDVVYAGKPCRVSVGVYDVNGDIIETVFPYVVEISLIGSSLYLVARLGSDPFKCKLLAQSEWASVDWQAPS